jgi:hypothetical protein
MLSQKETQVSLRQRVDGYLQVNSLTYARDASQEESVEIISSLLDRAKLDLEAAKKRVVCLKLALERTQILNCS